MKEDLLAGTERFNSYLQYLTLRFSSYLNGIALNAYLSASWPHVAQVAQLTRTVTTARKTSQQVVYLLTTLPPTLASPARLLELVRGHWGIENRLFYVRDVTFGEDRAQLRTGHAPQIMSALRNLVITLIHRDGFHADCRPPAPLCLSSAPGFRLAASQTIHSPFSQEVHIAIIHRP